LQQTAEYIDRLELEKQQLMTSNQHLQRLVDSIGGGNNNNNNTECPAPQQQLQQQQPQQQIITSSPSTGAVKKRKLDQLVTVQTISDSSDEGLGSMSPEPVSQMIFSNGSSTITKTIATSVTNISVKDYVNLQNQMEAERRHRIQAEEQLKQMELQVYERNNYPQKYHQIHHQEIVEQEEMDEIDGGSNGGQQQQQQQIEEKIILRGTGPILSQDGEVHYISAVHPQFVVVSTPGSSPKHIIVNDDDDNSRTLSSDELHKDEIKMLRKLSPKHREIRVPSILEQAIKAEPKVEVERINSPCVLVTMNDEAIQIQQSPSRTQSPPVSIAISRTAAQQMRTTYPNNSQRPNLETIVEAIRHLEGDAFDMDDQEQQQQQTSKCLPAQDAPLALTTGNKYQVAGKDQQPFLKFRHGAASQSGLPTFSVQVPQNQQQQQQQQQQQRPGVIVVKQSS